jgi:hypothetical protein
MGCPHDFMDVGIAAIITEVEKPGFDNLQEFGGFFDKKLISLVANLGINHLIWSQLSVGLAKRATERWV